jgi:hypothetical protein
MMNGYTKLFSSIVSSTIWQEDLATKVVWITLLALSDSDGTVEGSIPGLAHIAGVSLEECERALITLQRPDKYSRTPDNDGRRIEAIEGGWFILNRVKYRDLIPEERRRERDRIRQQRRRKKQEDVTMSRVTECDSHDLSHQKEKEKEKTTTTKQSQSSETSSSRPGKRTRRKRITILSVYPQTVSDVVNQVLPIWPLQQPNGEKIRPDVAAFAGRVDQILRDNEDASPELLIKAAEKYLSEPKKFYRAPQFFFGPGNGTETPWVAYARMIVHQASKSQTSEPQPVKPNSHGAEVYS